MKTQTSCNIVSKENYLEMVIGDACHNYSGDVMLPPALAICNNWVAVPLPPHISELNPTRAELIVTSKDQVGALYAVTGKNKFEVTTSFTHNCIFKRKMPI
jgi:hypothetical protein